MPDQSAELTEFSEFYTKNVPRLVAFLVCKGLSITDAADCVQETLIAARPPVWATLEYPYAWCRRVALRNAYDLAQGRREMPVPEPVEVGWSSLVPPGLDVAQFEADHDFLYWLARLGSARQREVLSWTYDGATPAEIAGELGLHPDTVRSTLRNARAVLRRLRAEAVSRSD